MIHLAPEGEIIQAWLRQQPAIHFSLPGNVHVYLLQKGANTSDLWRRLHAIHLPDIPYLWAAYGRAIRSQDHEAAMQAFVRAAFLSDYTRSREDYFIPSEYSGVNSEREKNTLIVETRADYLTEAAHEALVLGKTDQSLDLLAQAEALDPQNPQTLLHKGWALLQAGHYDEAIDVLRRVREEQSGQNPWLYIFLGKAYVKTGQYENAIASYQEGLQLAPQLHQFRFLLAAAYQAMGDAAMARHWYQDYLDHAPHDPLADQARHQLQKLPGS